MPVPLRDEEIAGFFDRSIAVLVLNFGQGRFLHGTLGVIRSLGRLGIPVFTIQLHPRLPVGSSRYLAGKFLWPITSNVADQFLDELGKIGKLLGRPTILIASDDLSAILIAENADRMPPQFIAVRQPPQLPRTLADKRTLWHLCHRLGVHVPPTFFPESREELSDVSGCMQYPVIAKIAEPWLLPKPFRSVEIIEKREDLIEYYDAFTQRSSATSLMVQQVISGDACEDWFVHGYFDEHSRPLVLFTGIKLRSYPAFAGATTLARAVRNDALREQAIKICSDIHYRGIMDLDFRRDANGNYNLLDFNPRVGAQFRLFRSDAGMDVVRALHLHLTGRPLDGGQQIEGRTFMSEAQDVIAGYKYYRRGQLTLGDWMRSIRHIDECAWYAADDLRPFLIMSLSMPSRAFHRVSAGLNEMWTNPKRKKMQ
jgi:D-aspartate ligase